MAPKSKGAKLSDVAPTEAELDAARKLLADMDAKQSRSRMASMANFLKHNPDSAATTCKSGARSWCDVDKGSMYEIHG